MNVSAWHHARRKKTGSLDPHMGMTVANSQRTLLVRTCQSLPQFERLQLQHFKCILSSCKSVFADANVLSMPLWVASDHFYTLLLAFISQPRILGPSMFRGWVGGLWGRHPLNASNLSSGTLFLSLFVRHSTSISPLGQK